ncbi:LysR family transcriptional regulator [Aliihoeflea aestuarii]|jgi:DNA-binding transcriptional LysR family regulator|uniref:LysR family transcriptional regulator n=1 Tax=Aliihoeflea aestuarii TaxID=453840 RepID=UPI0020935296|nr:LysR family transcriptional regulator [Aliihoeflea aestuarii]MCO6390856.1 LysR family transcriptional regulator [Aliihoeflea aestuarii]
MNLKFLETFLWVARLKSFSAAADKLNITQAAVSARIASLEDELGVRLFEREGRSVQLTSHGIKAQERAQTIVSLVRNFVAEVSNPESQRGTLRLGVIDTISLSWLVELIDMARLRYPNVRFELYVDTSLAINDMLLRNELDIGLLMGPVIGQNILNLELCRYRCSWVASPVYGLGGRPVTIRELAAHPIISFPAGSKPHAWLARLLLAAGAETPLVFESNSLATKVRLARDGIGVAALPTVLIEEEAAAKGLEILDVTPDFPPLLVHASYVDDGHSILPGSIAMMAVEVAANYVDKKKNFMEKAGNPT